MQSQLPVRIEGGAVVIGNHRFSGEDVGYRLIYPNPLNPHKYVEVCSAVSNKSMEELPLFLTSAAGRGRVTEPDVIVMDQRANGLYPQYLAALTFDNNWRLEDRGPVLGRLEVPLSQAGMECAWGDFRADAMREASSADIALLEVDDHLYPQELAAGPVTRADLHMANNYSPIYTFQATGAELRAGLENMIDRYLHSFSNPRWRAATHRPLAVSGFSYAFYPYRPKGERVEANGLELKKLYRVAVTEHVLGQSTYSEMGGPGYLGWLPKIERTALNEIEAQEQYLRKHSPVKSVSGKRITEY
jgi:hypothetical protein